jgi:hypothetical protein
MKSFIKVIFIGALSSCAFSDGVEYRLYRNGRGVPTRTYDETLRIHVATFDALPLKGIDENAKYNRANCEFAQELFTAQQPHYRGSNLGIVEVKYWCEKGALPKISKGIHRVFRQGFLFRRVPFCVNSFTKRRGVGPEASRLRWKAMHLMTP